MKKIQFDEITKALLILSSLENTSPMCMSVGNQPPPVELLKCIEKEQDYTWN